MNKKIEQSCRICGNPNWSVLYRGPIRVGKFGNWSESDHIVWKCEKCQAGFLSPQRSLDYESSEYRNLVDGNDSVDHYYIAHDKEQAYKLQLLGTGNLRSKVIADIGCGAGSFLDLVHGITAETIAVEPAYIFHEELKSKGHKVYGYCHNALKEWEGKLDIVVSFAVLEHVEEPLKLLKEMKLLLKPEGILLMSTPNYEDWLIKLLPGIYDRFFYRSVHAWYFNREALQNIASIAGFSEVKIKYVQRFDLPNALLWIRDHRPTGMGQISFLQDLDEVYRKTLEKSGQTDFIYAWMKVSK